MGLTEDYLQHYIQLYSAMFRVISPFTRARARTLGSVSQHFIGNSSLFTLPLKVERERKLRTSFRHAVGMSRVQSRERRTELTR